MRSHGLRDRGESKGLKLSQVHFENISQEISLERGSKLALSNSPSITPGRKPYLDDSHGVYFHELDGARGIPITVASSTIFQNSAELQNIFADRVLTKNHIRQIETLWSRKIPLESKVARIEKLRDAIDKDIKKNEKAKRQQLAALAELEKQRGKDEIKREEKPRIVKKNVVDMNPMERHHHFQQIKSYRKAQSIRDRTQYQEPIMGEFVGIVVDSQVSKIDNDRASVKRGLLSKAWRSKKEIERQSNNTKSSFYLNKASGSIRDAGRVVVATTGRESRHSKVSESIKKSRGEGRLQSELRAFKRAREESRAKEHVQHQIEIEEKLRAHDAAQREAKERELYIAKKKLLKEENLIYREQRKARKDEKKVRKKERQRARRVTIEPQMGVSTLKSPYADDSDSSEEKVEFDADEEVKFAPASHHLSDEYLSRCEPPKPSRSWKHQFGEIYSMYSSAIDSFCGAFPGDTPRYIMIAEEFLSSIYLAYKLRGDFIGSFIVYKRIISSIFHGERVTGYIIGSSWAAGLAGITNLLYAVGKSHQIEKLTIHPQGGSISTAKLDFDYSLPQKNSALAGEFINSCSDSMEDLAAEIEDNTVLSALHDVILAAATLELFPSEMGAKVFRLLGKSESKSIVACCKAILVSMKTLTRAFDTWVRTGSLSEAMSVQGSKKEAINCIRYMLLRENDLAYGQPIEGRTHYKEFQCTMAKSIEVLKARLDGKSMRRRAADSAAYWLHTAEMSLKKVKEYAAAQSRLPPIGIAIVGLPKTGKSYLIDIFSALICKAYGIDFDRSAVFHRAMSSEYQEGYKPDQHLIWHYSELGKEKPSVAEKLPSGPADEILSLIDSQSLYANMAFADKGKICVDPIAVIADSNNPWLGFQHRYDKMGAIMRRFWRITVGVKNEYADGLGVDTQKALRDPYNIWTFKFETFGSNSDGAANVLETLDFNGECHEFYNFLYGRIVSKISSDRTVSDVFSSTNISTYLSSIGLEGSAKTYPSERKVDEMEEKQIFITSQAGEQQQTPWLTLRDIGVVAKSWGYASTDLITGLSEIKDGMVTLLGTLIVESAIGHKKNSIRERYSYWASFICILISLMIFLPLSSYLAVLYIMIALVLNPYELYFAMSRIVANGKWNTAQLTINEGMCKVHDALFGREEPRISDARARRIFQTIVGLAGVVGIAATGMAAYRMFKKGKSSPIVKLDEQAGHPVTKDNKELSRDIQKWEEFMEAGHVIKRKKDRISAHWNLEMGIPRPIHTSDALGLYTSISKNLRKVTIPLKSDVTRHTHLLGLRGNFAIINSHFFEGVTEPWCIAVEHSGRGMTSGNVARSKLYKRDLVKLSEDLSLLAVSDILFRDITMHIRDGPILELGKAVIDHRLVTFSTTLNVQGNGYIHPCLYDYMWDGNYQGACGMPLVGQLNGGAQIIGIHSGVISESSNHCLAVPIGLKDIKEAMLRLSDRTGLVTIQSQSYSHLDDLVSPSKKSPFRYENLPRLELFGSLRGVVAAQKSKITKTAINKKSFSDSPRNLISDIYGISIFKEWGPPVLKPMLLNGDYVPFNPVLREMNGERPALDRELMRETVEIISRHRLDLIKRLGIKKQHPLSLSQAINGPESDDLIRRINAHTGAGYSYPGKKSKYLTLAEDGITRIPTDYVMSEIDNYMESSLKGCPNAFVYTATLKDEAISTEKIGKGKTRIFYAGSLGELIVSRMVLAPIFAVLLQYADEFQSVIGIDMHRQGYVLADDATFSDKAIQWDHSWYDVRMHPDVVWMGISTIYNFARDLGYNEGALKLLTSVLSCTYAPTIKLLGDMFMVLGITPSGTYGTAERNCEYGRAMNVYAYLRIITHGNVPREISEIPYYKAVLLRLYGDDTRGVVKDHVIPYFNCWSIREVYNDEMGMHITSPDKTSLLEKWYDIEETSFLKRTQRWSHRYGMWFSPLEMESIVRMLSWVEKSKSVTEEMQLRDTINSALRELFFYDDDRKWVMIRERLVENYCIAFNFDPSEDHGFIILEDMKSFVRDASNHIAFRRGRRRSGSLLRDPLYSGVFYLDKVSEYYKVLCYDQSAGLLELVAEHTLILQNMLNELSIKIVHMEEELEKLGNKYGHFTHHDAKSQQDYYNHEGYRTEVDDYFGLKSEYEAHKATFEVLKRALAKHSSYVPQSGQEPTATATIGPADPDQVTTIETFEDMSGAPAIYDDNHAPWRSRNMTTSEYDLEGFFERPVFIGSLTWGALADITSVMQVSDVYFADPTVRSKLRNVAFIRGDWVVDISCSANQFMYGSAVVALVPFPLELPSLTAILNSELSAAGNHIQVAKYLSSMQGSKILDCNKNAVIRLRLPFISPCPAVRVFNNQGTALGTSSQFTDALRMVDLRFCTINQLNTTSAVSTNASITVYAHLENVELGPPTGSVISIVTQSGEFKERERDERVTGPVEYVASRLAHVAGLLSAIPEIAPFALASQIGFGALSRVAALLGWSIPTVNTPPMRMKNMPFQNAANLIGYDTGMRLTMDPRQEITISPGVVGSNHDEMSVRCLASKWSLLHTVPWSTSTAPLASPVFMTAVHPRARVAVTSGLTSSIQPTWIDAVTVPFGAWRGTIEYLIQVVCSPQHKGKLGVLVDPNIAQATLISSSIALHKQNIKVIDLQEVTEVVIKVDWQFVRDWALNCSDTVAGSMTGAVITPNSDMYECANGFLSIFPLTSLQSPNNNGCYINVFVRCPDLMVTQPLNAHIPTKRILYQSGDVCDKCCYAPEVTIINPTGSAHSDCCENQFGEHCVSFRALLHRFETTDMVSSAANSTTLKSSAFFGVAYPSAQTYGATSTDKTLLTYLRMMYLGMHGGIKKRYRACGLNYSQTDNMVVSLVQPEVTNVGTLASYSTQPASMNFLGGVTFVPSTNGGIEFEVPYYTNNQFVFAQKTDPFAPNGTGTYIQPSATRRYVVFSDAPGATAAHIHVAETAIGEDFSLLFAVAPAPYGL